MWWTMSNCWRTALSAGRSLRPRLNRHCASTAKSCWPPVVGSNFVSSAAMPGRAPATLACEVVEQGRLREFFGFNRAKHAVIEASILATRVHLIEPDVIRAELQQYATIVEKTAGDQEQRAFAFLTEWIHNKLASTLPLP